MQALADRAALRDQKERLEKELKQLKTQQSVAADRAASKAQAEKLYQDVLDAQKALEDFRRTQTLTAEEPEKLAELAQLRRPRTNSSAPATPSPSASSNSPRACNWWPGNWAT